MDQEFEELINDCIDLQYEIGLLTPIILFLSPSMKVEKMIETKMSNSGRLKMREKLKELHSPDRIRAEYMVRIKEFKNKLADVAELLEEEEFEMDKLRSQLSQDQFDWLTSHKKEIKKNLRGIELR